MTYLLGKARRLYLLKYSNLCPNIVLLSLLLCTYFNKKINFIYFTIINIWRVSFSLLFICSPIFFFPNKYLTNKWDFFYYCILKKSALTLILHRKFLYNLTIGCMINDCNNKKIQIQINFVHEKWNKNQYKLINIIWKFGKLLMALINFICSFVCFFIWIFYYEPTRKLSLSQSNHFSTEMQNVLVQPLPLLINLQEHAV